MIDPAAVRACLHRLFIAAEKARLRREDEKKAEELAGFLALLRGRVSKRAALVDAAAGKSPVGLAAVELLGVGRLVAIERDPARAAACREAAGRLSRGASVEVREGDLADDASWPARVDVVVALHACGAASDAVFAQAVKRGARWMVVAPCCYATAVPFSARAHAVAEALGAANHAAVRRPLVQALVDADRTLSLEAAGYEVTVAPFVAPTVTPHHLAWVCRRAMEPRAMEAAGRRRAALHAALSG
ncbi:MAG: methyltransferase [Polyangiales bacterium]